MAEHETKEWKGYSHAQREFNSSPKSQALHKAKQDKKPKRPSPRYLTKKESAEKTKSWPRQLGKFDTEKFKRSMGSEG